MLTSASVAGWPWKTEGGWRGWWAPREFIVPLLSVALAAGLFWITAAKRLAHDDPPTEIRLADSSPDTKQPPSTSLVKLDDVCTVSHPSARTFDGYKSGMVWGIAVTMLLIGTVLLVVQSIWLFLVARTTGTRRRLRAVGSAVVLYGGLFGICCLLFQHPPLASNEIESLIHRCIPKDVWVFPVINAFTAFGILCAAISVATTLVQPPPDTTPPGGSKKFAPVGMPEGPAPASGATPAPTTPPALDAHMKTQLSRLRWVLYVGAFVQTFAVFEVASAYELIQKASGTVPADFLPLSESAVLAVAFSASMFLFAIYVPAAFCLRRRAGVIDESDLLQRFQQVLAMAAPVLSTIPITSSLELFGLHHH